MTKKRYQVFISSTYDDLKEVRDEVEKTLYKMGYIPVGMECFGAQNEEVSETIRKYCEGTDLVILLIAGRYGSITTEGISYTESEYKYFRKHKIPILVFIREDNSILTSDWETNPESKEKLANFKKELRNNHTLAPDWTTSDDLIIKLQHSLNNMKLDKGWIRFDEKNYITPKETTIEHGMAVIKVKGTKEECETGKAIVEYFVSCLVDSDRKPVVYDDRVRAPYGILSHEFSHEAEFKYEDRNQYLDYRITTTDAENPLCFRGKVVVNHKLTEEKGRIGFHIPYNAKYMIFQVDISEADFIHDYKVEAKIEKFGTPTRTIDEIPYDDLSRTYIVEVEDAPADSNMVFEW